MSTLLTLSSRAPHRFGASSDRPPSWSCRLGPLLGLALAVGALNGCKSHELTERGTQVALLQSEPFGCENVGEIEARAGGASGGYVTESTLIDEATVRLRNQAAELGATHLLVSDSQMLQGVAEAAERHQQPALAHGVGANATALAQGIAYKCEAGSAPPKIVEALPAAQAVPGNISMAPLGALTRIVVYQRAPALGDSPASETEVLVVDDQEAIREVTASLMELALDPIRYVPTHRIEFVGAMGTQSLLYGFGYLLYAGKTYRLTTGTFERVLEVGDPENPAVGAAPAPAIETIPEETPAADEPKQRRRVRVPFEIGPRKP